MFHFSLLWRLIVDCTQLINTLILSQLLKILSTFYWTRNFTIVFTKTSKWSLFSASQIHSTSSWTHSSCLGLEVRSGSFLSCLQIQILHVSHITITRYILLFLLLSSLFIYSLSLCHMCTWLHVCWGRTIIINNRVTVAYVITTLKTT
jgi:hypothetical protein